MWKVRRARASLKRPALPPASHLARAWLRNRLAANFNIHIKTPTQVLLFCASRVAFLPLFVLFVKGACPRTAAVHAVPTISNR